MTRPRILLADDHRMMADGLREILVPEFELAEIVANGRELVAAALRHEPHVIIADISMPQLNGIEAIAQLRKDGCDAKVIFLTMHKDVTYAALALEVGASGFVLKHSASSELLTAVRAALAGQTYFSDEISRELEGWASRQRCVAERPTLTPRQREVLQLFAEGRTARQVAKALHISGRTAENHKARIMRVLGLSTTAELIQYAIRHGIITAE